MECNVAPTHLSSLMIIGEILVAQGLVTQADVTAALDRQKQRGGRLGDNLVALGKLQPADLEAVLHGVPPAPRTLAETGLGLPDLLNLMTKALYSGGVETPSMIAEALKLPHRTVQLLIEQAQERKLLDVLGAAGAFAFVRSALRPHRQGQAVGAGRPGAEPVRRPSPGVARRLHRAHPAPAHHQ
jgi:hypothetical protein